MNYEQLTEGEFLNTLKEYQELYTNDVSPISDEEFDSLVMYYENKFGKKFDQIGSLPRTSATPLPYYMPSLDKIKGDSIKEEHELELWMKRNTGPYLLQDKIDGCSLLYLHVNGKDELRTRGDGVNSEYANHLLPYLNLPKPEYNIVVRGELVIHKSDFITYAQKQKDQGSKNKLRKARNIVTGLINSKENFDPELARLVKFYAYTIVDWNYLRINTSTQNLYLSNLGFNTPWTQKVDSLTIPILKHFLMLRKFDSTYMSVYDIDGIVIINDIVTPLPESKNPDYEIAFKIDIPYEAVVKNIEWNLTSKSGIIVPRIIIEPIIMDGSEVNKASGKNAKFVLTNQIGIGSKIKIAMAGDIIPSVIECLTPGHMVYPSSDLQYKWDETETEFMLLNPNLHPDVQKAKLNYFVRIMNIKNLGPETINKLYDNGCKTIDDLIRLKPENIMILERMGSKSSEKIYQNIQNALKTSPLSRIMTASCIWNEGIGEIRFKSIIETYPNILQYGSLSKDELISMISSIDGFGQKLAENFSTNLPRFITWLQQNPQIQINNDSTIIPQFEKLNLSGKITGKKILFTGFRSSELKNKLISLGNDVRENISKEIDIVVTTGAASKKLETAKKYGLTIMSLEDFKHIYEL